MAAHSGFFLPQFTKIVNGVVAPNSAGKVYTYTAGTTSLLTTYKDELEASPHENPIQLDADGFPPGGAIFWQSGVVYDVVENDASNALVRSWGGVRVSAQSEDISNLIADFANATDPAKGPALSGFGPTKAYAKGTVGAELRRVLYADSFPGVDPTGATDSTVGVNAALTELATRGGGELIFGGGTYKVGVITLPNGVKIRGQGRGKTTLQKATSGQAVISGAGTLGTGSALTADVAPGVMTIPVSSAAGFSIGGWVLLREDTYISGSAGRKQQITRVIGIAGLNIKVSLPTFEGYTTASAAQLIPLTPLASSGIHDLTLQGINASASGGLVSVQYAAEFSMSGVAGRYFSAPGAVLLQTCYRSEVSGCQAVDGIDMATQGQGYGFVADEACAFVNFVGCYSENVRENLLTNRTAHSKFQSCVAVGNYDNGFNTHGAGVAHCSIEDCEVIGTQVGSGISVGFGTHTAADTDITVRRNRIRATAATALAVNAPVGKENLRVVLSENKILSPGITVANSVGILVSNAIDIESSNNVIDGATANVTAGFQLVNVLRGEFSEEVVRGVPSGYGYRLSGCTDVQLLSPAARAISSYNFFGDGTNATCYIQGAITDDTTEALGAGLTKEGRSQRGIGSVTLAAESTKNLAVTFPAAFPVGVVPVVNVTAGNDASGQWVTGTSSVSNTGFLATITDRSGTARTGTVNIAWSATE